MDEAAYQAEFARLREEIESLPAEQQQALLEMHAQTVERHAGIQRSRAKSREALAQLEVKFRDMSAQVFRMDEALNDLRLKAKLLLFEFEARQREQSGESGDAPAHD